MTNAIGNFLIQQRGLKSCCAHRGQPGITAGTPGQSSLMFVLLKTKSGNIESGRRRCNLKRLLSNPLFGDPDPLPGTNFYA